MFNLPSYKSNQFLWLVFKLMIVIACGFFIYDIIANNEKLRFNDFQSVLIDFNLFSIKNIGLLFIFTFFNWFLEITKWYVLVKKSTSISWIDAAKQSLASLTFSLITPNRIGEYGAKALYFEKEKRKDILLFNLAGNLYQLLITVIVGVFGILYLFNEFSIHTIQNVIILLVILTVAFLMIRFLQKRSIKVRHWISKIYTTLKIKKNERVFLISGLRYLVFSHQFYFLLLMFGIDISYWDAFAGISSMYLIASIIPMLSLFDFVVKGSVAIFVFSIFEIESVVILSITTIMWIFNFAIPAILGSYFVLTFKALKP